jgi:hypothetical protein
VTRERLIPLALALISLVGLVVSARALADRLEQYNTSRNDRVHYFIATDPTERPDFTFSGHPLTITPRVGEEGEGDLLVTYAGSSLTLPVQIPVRYAFPGLQRFRDWMRVLIFADGTGMSASDFEARIADGSLPPRLALVAIRRNAAELDKDGPLAKALGTDLDTPDEWGWNEVRRDKWLFDFHEFLPDGSIATQTLRFPESGASFYRRQVRAEQLGEPPPVRAEDELTEGTWQFQAALSLLSRPPAITMERQGLRHAGWTLPVASACTLGLLLGVGFALAPRRPAARKSS